MNLSLSMCFRVKAKPKPDRSAVGPQHTDQFMHSSNLICLQDKMTHKGLQES